MPNPETPLDAEHLIRQSGLKCTRARLQVLEMLLAQREVLTADEIYEKLLSRSIAVRFMGGYLRITAGTKEEHKALFSALEEIAKELSSL